MRRWVLCFFLVALTAAVYFPVRSYPFVNYDDQYYVVQNPHVQAGLSFATLVWSLTTTEQANWFPLTWLSHALDCQLFGLNPGWHHLTSLFIHGLNVLLLFLLLETVTGARGRSFLVAVFFAIHPFNVDSVAWISERKNLLSTLFFLLTLGAYGWYTRRPELKRYALIVLVFALGLAAKPMLVTLPFVLLLLDNWPLQRISGWSEKGQFFPVVQRAWPRLLIEKLPLLALALASSMATVMAQKSAILALREMPPANRLANAVASYAFYLWKTFWPSSFAVFYPNPFDPGMVGPVQPVAWVALAAGVLLLPAVTWMVWQQRRDRPYLVTGWLWYLGTMVPVIGIVQVGMQGMADRYGYIPLLGIFVIAAWGTAEIADRFRLKPAFRPVLAIAVITTLAFLSARQVGYWRSSYDLWTHALAVTSRNSLANDQIGELLVAGDHPPEAMPYFEAAARIDPYDPTSHQWIAWRLQGQGQLKDAIRNYQIVVRESQDPAQLVFADVNLCVLFGELGDYARAHDTFAHALRTDPQRTEAEVRRLAEDVSAHPADEGYLRLGLLLDQGGQLADARAAYKKALALNPKNWEAQSALDHLQSPRE
jgi:protein O-mannosyl-transferase